MSQERAFIEAIIARPGDDLPRLIYADWLEEHEGTVEADDGLRHLEGAGGTFSNGYAERAEFIRVQCELALWGNEQARPRAYGNWYVDCRHRKDAPGSEARCRAPSMPSSEECQYHTLRRRERELLAAHPAHPKWLGIYPDPFLDNYPWRAVRPSVATIRCGHPPSCIDLAFRRGFVSAVTCTAADWLRHGDQITAAAPIAEVAFSDWPFERLAPREQHDLYSREIRWPRVKTWNLPRETQFNQPNPAGQLIHRFQACTACGGDGLSTPPPEARPCRRCNGAGRLPMPRRAAVAPSR